MTPMSEYLEARERVAEALKAHDRVLSNHVITGSTEADRRFSDGEAEDSAREAMFDGLASLTPHDLRLLLAGPPVSREEIMRALFPVIYPETARLFGYDDFLRGDAITSIERSALPQAADLIQALYQGAPK
ncbi:MAG: hypothetical protein WAW13_00565 [Minisyncoccia bacterium]